MVALILILVIHTPENHPFRVRHDRDSLRGLPLPSSREHQWSGDEEVVKKG